MALADAVEALAAGERERALVALLEAWREVRHPRIADLIDAVSDELTAAQPAIKGKTVAARTTAWHAVEAQRDPADLGRLLATPWPKTWKPALAMLKPLLRWPDDPRLAIAFARIVEERPYDTWTSEKLYLPLLEKLEEQRDLRMLPMLRRARATRGSRFYEQDVRPREDAILEKLGLWFPDDKPPALTAGAVAALEQLEQRYAERISGAKQRAEGAVDHLAAILDAPDDLALRAVYADWLQEQGDPRGEFIALQLARLADPTSDAAIAREHKLLTDHGKAWAGTLDRWFEDKPRVWHAGFFAGGKVRIAGSPDEWTASLDEEPMWRLVRKIAGRGRLFDLLLAAPQLTSLVECDVDYDGALALAASAQRSFVALHFESPYDLEHPPLDTALAQCYGLPALRELGIKTRHAKAFAAWVAEAPVFDRVERLVVREQYHAPIVTAAERRGGALRELVVNQVHVIHGDTGWHFLLQRDSAPGPFTRLVVRPRGAQHRLEGLALVLEKLPATLRELTIATPKKLTLPEAEKAALATAIKRFKALEHCELPWALEGLPEPRPKVDAPLLILSLDGETLFAADKIPAVWKLVSEELGLDFDSFDVGSRWRELQKDPVAQLQKWSNNARCYALDVHRDGAPARLRLVKPHGHFTQVTTTLLLPSDVRPPHELIAWVIRLIELGTFTMGHCIPQVDGLEAAFDLEDLACGVTGGWLVYFGAPLASRLPADEVRAAGFAAYEAGGGLLVAVASSPAETTAERLTAAARTLTRIMRAQIYARLGYDLQACIAPVIDPVARACGLVPYDDPKRPRSTSVQYAVSSDPYRRIVIELADPFRMPILVAEAVWLYVQGDEERRNTGCGGFVHLKVPDRDTLDVAIARLAEELPERAARLGA